MPFSWPSSWFNFDLAKHPLNWLVVGVVATIWLIAFHVIMQGFTSMQGGTLGSGGAPGTTPSPQVGNALTNTPDTDPTEIFTDDTEARYVGDGWLANP